MANPPFHKDTMRTPFVKRIVAVTDHAVLDSNDRVVLIAKYPLSEKKYKHIIPFPDLGKKPKFGWYYNRDTLRFQEEKPE